MKNITLAFLIISLLTIHADAENVSGIMLPDSSVYEGEIENNKFNGTGTLTWRNGAYYKGEFKEGLIHGKGYIKFANGNQYIKVNLYVVK
jgi:hypothetical protein